MAEMWVNVAPWIAIIATVVLGIMTLVQAWLFARSNNQKNEFKLIWTKFESIQKEFDVKFNVLQDELRIVRDQYTKREDFRDAMQAFAEGLKEMRHGHKNDMQVLSSQMSSDTSRLNSRLDQMMNLIKSQEIPHHREQRGYQ